MNGGERLCFMEKRKKLVLRTIGLILTISVVLISAIPIYSAETDARLIGLFLGSFTGGLMLAGLIREFKRYGGSE